MPIQAEPDGTLDVENATLRSRNIVSLTNMVAGNDVVRSSAAPTLEVYGDPSHGGTEPTLELVSNTSNTVSTTFTRLTSNAGVFTIQSGTDGTTNSKGDIAFSSIGGTTERMRIQGSTGNVGIGTNNPDTDFKLHVHGGPTKSDGFVLGTGTNEYTPGCIYTDGNWGMLFRSAVETPGAADFVFNNYSGSNLMAIKSGKVGIGTANPAAKLHVNGGAGGIYATAADFTRYFSWGTGSSVVGGTGNFNFTSISVYGTNDIGTAGTFVSTIRAITASDKRIKRDVVDIEDDEALQLLRLIEPKKYKYKDVLGRGDEEVYGFIAQQISNVFPEATQLRSSYIPNIYETANVASNTITFTNFNTSNLDSNATTLIRTKGIDGEDHDIHLVEVIDEHTIRVEEDLSEWTGSIDENGNLAEGDQIFVYGQEVDDFIYIKKDSIWTVATSALQEVDRQLQAEKVKVASLETQLTSVLTRLDALESA
jgi:hypothetical protein